MATFQYSALDDRGRKKKGYIEAESQARAYNLLQEKGLAPLEMKSVSGQSAHQERRGFSLANLLPGGTIRVGESFHYLGIMLQTGSSLAQGLELLGRMTPGAGGRTWIKIRDAVESGEPFSRALEGYPRHFKPVYIGMVRVAEGVGRLGQVLERIAQYEEQRSEVSGKLLTAMVYPAVIFLVGVGAVYFLLSSVLPKISGIFKASKGNLPDSTKMLLTAGEFMQNLGPGALLGPLLLLGLGVFAYKRFPAFKAAVDKRLWKLNLVQKYQLARFSGLLGFQLESGIPLVQALESASMAVSSAYFRDLIREAKEEVATGRALDRVLAKQGVYPEVYILTLSSGQKTGQLGPFLMRLTRILEHDVDNILKRLVALAEPLLILFIGLLIGFIVMAIMGPIFDLTTLVK